MKSRAEMNNCLKEWERTICIRKIHAFIHGLSSYDRIRTKVDIVTIRNRNQRRRDDQL
jgi:hypothetical protein